MTTRAEGQGAEGTQAGAEHTDEGGNTAVAELDRLAAAQDGEEAGAGEGEGAETGEGEGEGTGDGAGDGAGAGAGEGEGGDEDSRVVFTPEQQAVFNKRVGKEVAKTKALQTQFDELKAVQSAANTEIARSIQLHPAYVTKDDFALIQTVNVLEAEQDILAEAQADEEITLDKLPKATQAWIKANYPNADAVDKKMLARRATVIQRELQTKAGKADAAYETAKKLQLSDLALGRKVRMEREAARKKAGDAAGDKGKPAQSALRTASRPVATGAETRRDGVNQAKLATGGNTAEALMDAIG